MVFDPDAYLSGSTVSTVAPPAAKAPASGSFDPDAYRNNFVEESGKSDDFDPVGYALQTGDSDTAKEIAWRQQQRPMTMDRFGKLAKKFGGAAVDMVKDFGGGVGDIAADTWFIAHAPDSDFWKNQGIDPTTARTIIEKAKTQQLLRAQLIEEHGGNFLGKIAGKEGFLAPVGRRLAQAIIPAATFLTEGPTNWRENTKNAMDAIGGDIDDRKKNPRKYFDASFDNKVAQAKEAMEIQNGKIKDDGLVSEGLDLLHRGTQVLFGDATLDAAPDTQGNSTAATPYLPSQNFESAEDLQNEGAPIDPDSIRRGSVTADPVNLLPLHLPGASKVLNPVAGAGLRAVAAPIRAGVALAEKLPNKISKISKYGLVSLPAAYEGYQFAHDPEQALKALGIAATAYAGLKGAKLIGHVLDNAGQKLINPKFVSAAERDAAEAMMDANRGTGGQLSAFNPTAMKADAERALTRIPMAGAAAPVVMAPLNAAISDNPEEFAQLEGGVAGFGALAGATSYNPVNGFRPEAIQAVDSVLRDQGAQKKYGTPLDAAHDAYMATAPEAVRDGVNAYRGFFDGFKLPSGEEPKIYVLPGDQFAAEVARRNGKISPDLARQQRGFKDKDGTALINGDFGNEAPSILGHEAGGHIAQTIMELYAPDVARQLQRAAYRGLMSNGKPTPKLQKFIDGYNKAFDPTGQTQGIQNNQHAIEEFLAEQGRDALTGGPAKFAAAPGLREAILDNVGDYFRRLFGTNHKFDRSEVPGLASEYRNLLFELGRLRGTTLDDGAASQPSTPPQPTPARPAPTGGIPAPVAPAPAGLAPVVPATAGEGAAPPVAGGPVAVPNQEAPATREIEPPRPGDPEPGSFAIHPDEQAILQDRGFTPEQINSLPLHQLEAELAADGRAEPAPEASEAVSAPTPRPSAEMASTGQLTGFSTPSSAPAVPGAADGRVPAGVEPQNKGVLTDFDPNANKNPSTSGEPGAPEQRPDDSAPAGAKEVPPVSQEAIDAALAEADRAAAEDAAKKRPGKARSPARIAADAKQARIDALSALLAPDGPGLHPVTDPATGETTFRGEVDPENPVHAAILKEFGYLPDHIRNIENLQRGKGKGVWLRDYNAAEQEGHETGEGLELTGEKRGKEYDASPTGEAGKRQGGVTKQDKAFTPYDTVLTSKGVVIRGFDHDKFLGNLRSVMDAAKEAGIETGLDGKNGEERDAAIAEAFRKVAENHANGWKGDGSEPLKTFPDTGISQNLDYVGQPVEKPLANLINMAMNIRTSKPPKAPRGKSPTELAQKRYAARSADAKEAQGLAALNDGFLNPETGETNPLRQALEDAGFETDKELKPTISNVRPDLIEGGIHDTPTHGRNVHAHGFDIPAPDLTASGSPHGKPTSAGFMPGDGGQLGDFMPGEGESSIKSKEALSDVDELGFYSGLGRIIQDKIPNRASGEQILATIKGAGAKAEEMESLGLEEFLKTKSGPVSKQELQDFVKAGGVQLKEVTRGKHEVDAATKDRLWDKLNDLEGSFMDNMEEDYTHEDGELRPEMIRDERDFDDAIIKAKDALNAGNMDEVREAIKEAANAERRHGDNPGTRPLIKEVEKLKDSDDTKFSEYQLPGGENYKEVLLTLPEKNNAPKLKYEIRQIDTPGKLQDGWWEIVDQNGEQRSASPNREYIEKTKKEWEALGVTGKNTAENFRSSHWDEPNVLAHLRQADHTDTEGNKVRLIEEIQSDWHQKGRKEGYGAGVDPNESARLARKEDAAGVRWSRAVRDAEASVDTGDMRDVTDRSLIRTVQSAREEMDAAVAARREADSKARNSVPDAPFKKTWAELAFKRALRMAVEDGMDKIAWTPGEQQAERYDLSKQVDSIDYLKMPDGKYSVMAMKDGHTQFGKIVSEGELADMVGKDVAQKIASGEGKDVKGKADGLKSLTGIDLKVGGEGMKGFYDKILPDFVKKYVKKWGGKVETAEIQSTSDGPENGSTFKILPSREQAKAWAEENLGDHDYTIQENEGGLGGFIIFDEYTHQFAKPKNSKNIPVHSVTITPEMREAIMAGQPMFMPGGEKSGATLEDFTPEGRAARDEPSIVSKESNGDLSGFMPGDHSGRSETMVKTAPDEKKARFRADMMAQMKWMGGQAQEAGHDSVDALMTDAPEKYAELATQWRQDHPRFDAEGRQLFMPGEPVDNEQTKSEPFKRWFGKSVVNRDGKPVVLYHSGSFDANDPHEPAIFRSSFEGVHFGSKESAMDRIGGKVVDDHIQSVTTFHDKDGDIGEPGKWYYEIDGQEYEDAFDSERAAQGAGERMARAEAQDFEVSDEAANMTPVFLKIENPVRMPDLATWKIEEVKAELRKQKILSKDEADSIGDDYVKLKSSLQKKGYDGFVYRNEFEDKGNDSYVVFDGKQVKSAELNSGEFDPENADIRFMPGENGIDESEPSMLAMPGEAKRTWFKRGGRRVYHRRGDDGTFRPKQTLANPPTSANTSRDRKELEDFAP